MNNPFDITKAVDFTDHEIVKYWVDISNNREGFKDILKPTSLMPMIILGSKGSGKTHLMRYFSYELQKIKHQNLEVGLNQDNFIGVYIRCSGFNSERFSKKGQSKEIWSSVYAYYWELWIAQILLNIVIDLQDKSILVISNEIEFVEHILGLLNRPVEDKPSSIKDTVRFFSNLQKKVDYEVENCMFSDKKLQIEILISPTRITYGLPDLLKKLIPFFNSKVFLYLIDELENISESQQELIQTLLREKPVSCSFRLGARLYGIKTYKTLGSNEENREGSEFEKIVLDDFLRHNDNYSDFVRQICEHRIKLSGIYLPNDQKLDDYIERFNFEEFIKKIKSKRPIQGKSYLARLKGKLKGKLSDDNIDFIIKNLTFDDVLIERTNVLYFYRSWSDQRDLINASIEINRSALDYCINPKDTNNQHNKILGKFKSDIIDMLARETRENIPCYGFNDFVLMSCGTPRNLLNILKHSYKWTYFNEAKEAFRDNNVIRLTAQAKGIKNTIDWFFEDNRIPAIKEGKLVDCIDRLGKFLRELKYSDVPPECSINIFSLKLEELSMGARNILNFLISYSYIIEVNERRDKNSNDLNKTFHINGIIATNWELSLSKRGVIFLSAEEAESIFNLKMADEFEKILHKKKQKYNAPFSQNQYHQPNLFQ